MTARFETQAALRIQCHGWLDAAGSDPSMTICPATDNTTAC